MVRPKPVLLAALTAAILAAGPATAQSAQDEAAIRAAALDYIEGWYMGDAARMERALHPELAKRIVFHQPDGDAFNTQGALTLIQSTRNGGGSDTPADEQRTDVTILDVYENAASVRVDAGRWIDYLHLARWDGEWKIVNVLWELRPQE